MSGTFGVVGPSRTGACPCGAGPPGMSYDDCCRPLHEGQVQAATAEALMRSRYAAFAMGDQDYLLRTWHPRSRPEEVRLDPRHRWTSLEVLATSDGGVRDLEGSVTYRARSRGRDGREHVMTEVSRFARRAGRWLYVDGDVTD